MKSRGRGIKSQEEAAAPTPVSSAWADFLKEEGQDDLFAAASAPAKQSSGAQTGQKRSYQLPASQPPKKKAKKSVVGGELVQMGTLDSSVVGRSKPKLDASFHLTVPTRILSKIKITRVFTSCNASHSVAIDTQSQAYGWGRNEHQQLGSALPDEVILPTPLELPDDKKCLQAALGKSHTLFLLEKTGDESGVYAVGLNKAGQGGVRSSTEKIPNLRKCQFDGGNDISIVQIACGEDFSVAVSSEGFMYTTGSSEFGQLGNGETGEYFISANKLAFANCNVFTKRTTWCHAPGEKLHIGDDRVKVVPLDEDIRIQQVACGKHHTLAIEAPSSDPGGPTPRVFSFGSGNYGCLGHGIQRDEYFPRLIGSLAAMPLVHGEMTVEAGSHCSLLKTVNGHLYYWGKHRSVGEATMRPDLVDVLANNQHVVSSCAAGASTVVCSTQGAVTVAWGQGKYGELGLPDSKMSSAKPEFVSSLDGCRIQDLACGQGHTLLVVTDEDKEDKKAIKSLPEVDPNGVAMLERVIASRSK